MSYTDTFIQVADDCPVSESVVPSSDRAQPPIHLLQYELLTRHPYAYDHEELVFAVHVRRQGISEEELTARRDALWAELFQKGHPCLRASALTKRYGWGAHYNAAGKIALVAMESDAYRRFVENDGGATKLLKAIRRSRV